MHLKNNSGTDCMPWLVLILDAFHQLQTSLSRVAKQAHQADCLRHTDHLKTGAAASQSFQAPPLHGISGVSTTAVGFCSWNIPVLLTRARLSMDLLPGDIMATIVQRSTPSFNSQQATQSRQQDSSSDPLVN